MHDPTTLHAELRATDEADQIGYARYLCEQYLQIHADHGPTWLRLAGHLISLAQYTAAESALDRAESLAPEVQLHRILTQRGHLHAAQGNFQTAKNLFLQAHKMQPQNATNLIFAGSMAFRAGEIDQARKLAQQATECTEGCIDEAWFNLGGYCLSAQQYREAEECYHRALKIDPEYEIAKERLRDVQLIIAREVK